MTPRNDWDVIDDDEDEKLQDLSYPEGERDVILFCIDCSESMQKLHEDQTCWGTQTCYLFTALAAAVQIQQRKLIAGPNDAVGIVVFNTTRETEVPRIQYEIPPNTFVFQPISPLNAPTIPELVQLLEGTRKNPEVLRQVFPPVQNKDKRVSMGDVLTSCLMVLHADGAPKIATKRIFLITDEDDPHSDLGNEQHITPIARNTFIDLTKAGVLVEPFFISTTDKPFNVMKFYSSVLLPTGPADDDKAVDPSDPSVLPDFISILRIEALLAQMRLHEVPKHEQCSVPFEFGEGLTIGVKGYNLVREQKKAASKYLMKFDDRMEITTTQTVYIDEVRGAEVEKTQIRYGTSLPFYTAEDIRSFRTMGLEPGIKLLGFKDRSELAFEDNIKHSHFLYPDEMAYPGSKQMFGALIKSLVKKKKMGLVLALLKRSATPIFCALLPQEEKVDEVGCLDPAGFHLIPLPFVDDIRQPAITKAARASESLRDAACAWVDRLFERNSAYIPDLYPNPALGYHDAWLEAIASGQEFDSDSFKGLALPQIDMIHQRAGTLMKAWRGVLNDEESAAPKKGTKRKAEVCVDEAEIRSLFNPDQLGKLRVTQLQHFLKSKGQPFSGSKKDLAGRVNTWFSQHP